MTWTELAWPFGLAVVLSFLRLFENHTANLTFRLLIYILLGNVGLSAAITLSETSPSPEEFFLALFGAVAATIVGALIGTGAGYLSALVRRDIYARRAPIDPPVADANHLDVDPMVAKAVKEALRRHDARNKK